MATHSSILAWKISWPEEPGGLQSMGSKESDMTERLTLNLYVTVCAYLAWEQCLMINNSILLLTNL